MDTCNLIDHLGALNVLMAVSPLLKDDRLSFLYAESVVKRKNSHKAYIDTLICGDLPTIALLPNLSLDEC